MLKPEEQLAQLKRGTVEIIKVEELLSKLERSYKTNTPLLVKQGFDPTAPDLHIGHTVSLRKLRQFQDLGHRVVFLIGDFTGMIGDPSAMESTRRKLTREEVIKNSETYKKQVFKILDPEKTIIDFNSRWNNKLSFANFLEIASRYTVARLLERDDFQRRIAADKPISLMEFLYPIVQGYDSVALRNDVELGGTDQKFNLLVGRVLQKEFGLEPQVVITMPLLEGTDGIRKMSKSYGNYIGINEPPSEIYGKSMSIPDNLIYKYFELATDVSLDELKDIASALESDTNPMELKKRLASKLVEMYWGEAEAKKAQREFERVFQRKQLPEEMKTLPYPAGTKVWLVRAMQKGGIISSSSEGIRLIKAGAVSIDGKKVKESGLEIVIDREIIIKAGKRRFLRLIPED